MQGKICALTMIAAVKLISSKQTAAANGWSGISENTEHFHYLTKMCNFYKSNKLTCIKADSRTLPVAQHKEKSSQ